MNLQNVLGLIQARASQADPLGNTLKFDFGGDQLYIDGTQGTNTISTEDKAADCTVSVSKEDFKDLLSGDLNPMMAVMSGKIRLSGDMGVAMKLQSLFG